MVEIQEEMVKGRIAESIVRCMFEDLGFEVVPYGYEHTCPTLARETRKGKQLKGDSSSIIKKAPDFIVIDNNGNASFVEVKYRNNGIFKREADYPYRDCYIILLTDKYMGIEQYKNLQDEARLDGNNFTNVIEGSFKSLMDTPLFAEMGKEDKEVILKYRELLVRYMDKNGK
jgi:hypothetical protein